MLKSIRMKRFIVVSVIMLAIAFQANLHGQGSGQPTRGLATQAPNVVNSILFKDQSPERQQYIMAHPELFKVLDNGTVDILAAPTVNLVQDAPKTAEHQAVPAKAGDAAPRLKPDLPKKITAIEILSLPPAVQHGILENQADLEITKSELTQKEFDRLRPDQQKTIEMNPSLFTVKQ